jgi:hypothetical protein
MYIPNGALDLIKLGTAISLLRLLILRLPSERQVSYAPKSLKSPRALLGPSPAEMALRNQPED